MGGTAVQQQRHHAFIRSLWRRGRGGDSILGIVGNSALLRIRHPIRIVHAVSARPHRLEVVVKVKKGGRPLSSTLGSGGESSLFLSDLVRSSLLFLYTPNPQQWPEPGMWCCS